MIKVLGGPGDRVGLMALPTFHATVSLHELICAAAYEFLPGNNHPMPSVTFLWLYAGAVRAPAQSDSPYF
jgi:hypothetical protein